MQSGPWETNRGQTVEVLQDVQFLEIKSHLERTLKGRHMQETLDDQQPTSIPPPTGH